MWLSHISSNKHSPKLSTGSEHEYNRRSGMRIRQCTMSGVETYNIKLNIPDYEELSNLFRGSTSSFIPHPLEPLDHHWKPPIIGFPLWSVQFPNNNLWYSKHATPLNSYMSILFLSIYFLHSVNVTKIKEQKLYAHS